MAAGSTLVITFVDAYSTERNFSFKYAKPAATAANIRLAAQTIIANGSIFTHVPVTAKSAKLVTTTETDVDISE